MLRIWYRHKALQGRSAEPPLCYPLRASTHWASTVYGRLVQSLAPCGSGVKEHGTTLARWHPQEPAAVLATLLDGAALAAREDGLAALHVVEVEQDGRQPAPLAVSIVVKPELRARGVAPNLQGLGVVLGDVGCAVEALGDAGQHRVLALRRLL